MIKFPKILRSFVYFIILLSIVNCTYFLSGNFRTSPNNFKNSGKSIHYELIGWNSKGNRKNVNLILKAFHDSNKFKRIDIQTSKLSDYKIQIILEKSPEMGILLSESNQSVSAPIEKQTSRYSLFLLNRVVSTSTRLVFPWVNRFEKELTFKVWKEGNKVYEKSYIINKLQIMGWISLFIFPFDESKEIKEMYYEYTVRFIKGFEHIIDNE